MASEVLDREQASLDSEKLNAFMGKMVGDMGAATKMTRQALHSKACAGVPSSSWGRRRTQLIGRVQFGQRSGSSIHPP